jgi:23S rRNA (cytidine1920-2'-O)/16S rRNA (cytidine1409-2'-O)-methyltransferase
MTPHKNSTDGPEAGQKQRLDKLVKQRRLIRSRSRAQRMISAGRVEVDGQVITRPGHPTDPESEIEILSYEQYVSRGGEKLQAALQMFRVEPRNQICLDIGASTGGFTDCLLQHGAKKVFAVDVGHDQLHPRIRRHRKVVSKEGINVRYLEQKDIGESIALTVIDVSFISLRLILPPLADIVATDGDIIALVKPQFEVGKDKLPSDGVVKDEADRQSILRDLQTFIEAETPWRIEEQMRSPLLGAKGNVEYFLHLRHRNRTEAP